MELIGYAVDKIAHKVIAVNTLDAYAHGVEERGVLIEVYAGDGVAILRCHADGDVAVALVECCCAIALLKADDLITWQWMTLLAA